MSSVSIVRLLRSASRASPPRGIAPTRGAEQEVELRELAEVLRRASRAGIDPCRVLVALGHDPTLLQSVGALSAGEAATRRG